MIYLDYFLSFGTQNGYDLLGSYEKAFDRVPLNKYSIYPLFWNNMWMGNSIIIKVITDLGPEWKSRCKNIREEITSPVSIRKTVRAGLFIINKSIQCICRNNDGSN